MRSKENNTLMFMVLIRVTFFVTLIRSIELFFSGHSSMFSPIEAMALFSGAYFSNKRLLPFLMTFLSVWVSDIFIDRIYLGQWVLFYQGFYWQYCSLLLITLIGFTLKNRITIFNVSAAGVLSAILFFVISNFGVWVSWLIYPPTKEGLILCYVAAIPFFKYSLLSNLFYCSLLFGGFEFMQKKFFSLHLKST